MQFGYQPRKTGFQNPIDAIQANLSGMQPDMSTSVRDIPRQPIMSYKIENESETMPGVEKGRAEKIEAFVQENAKSPAHARILRIQLHQQAVQEEQNLMFRKDKEKTKQEIITRIPREKDENQKKKLQTIVKLSNMADFVRDGAKQQGYNYDQIEDQKLLEEYVNNNPDDRKMIEQYLNNEIDEVAVAQAMGLIPEKEIQEEEGEEEKNFFERVGDNFLGGIKNFGDGVRGVVDGFGDTIHGDENREFSYKDISGIDKLVEEKYGEGQTTGTLKANNPEEYQKFVQEIRNNPELYEQYKTSISQDLLNTGEGVLDISFTTGAPYLKTIMATAGVTKPGEKVLGVIGEVFGSIGGAINKIPGLSDFRESLPEQDRKRFDAFVGNVIGGMLLGTKGKRNMFKSKQHFVDFVKNNINPVELSRNFQENVLGVPKKAINFGKEILNRDRNAPMRNYNKNKELFIKGTKPTVKGKQNITDFERFTDNGVESVGTIVENKENLKFVNDIGEEIRGELPKSLSEFSDAIKQTKNHIYEKYNQITKKAGGKGAVVDTAPIVEELNILAKNRPIKASHPEIGNIIENMKTNLEEIGTLTIEEAQQLTQQLNQKLKTFYKNGNVNDIGRSTVESMVNNNIKKLIDESIENTLGEKKEYSGLKKEYGQLRSIEEEVAKRALVDARKNAKGLFDFTDIYSANQVIDSIATMNPAGLVKGGGSFLIKEWYKRLNDPNRHIKKLFKNVEKEINEYGEIRNPKKGNITTESLPLGEQGKGNVVISKAENKIKNKAKENLVGGIKKPKKEVKTKLKAPKSKFHEEAKKYKSADEFVEKKIRSDFNVVDGDGKKPSSDFFYHGTNAKFDKFDSSFFGKGEGSNKIGEGVYITNSKNLAKEYGKNVLRVKISNMDLVDYNQIKTLKGYYDFFDKHSKEFELYLKSEGKKGFNPKVKFAHNQGFDGIKYSNNEVVVFNPKQIKTEAQLKKIREEANPKTTTNDLKVDNPVIRVKNPIFKKAKKVGKGEFGDIYEGVKGAEAEQLLIYNKGGEVKGAYKYKGQDVDLMWGEYKDGKGYGLAKIHEKHPEVLGKMQNLLDELPVKELRGDRIILASDKSKLVISLNWKGAEKRWIVTAFDLK